MNAPLNPTRHDLAAEMLARVAHSGQVDKSGAPYIDHVEAVANSPYVTTSHEWQAAWLHDVLEDTHVTHADLEAHGFDDEVITAVMLLTHWPMQARHYYMEALLTNEIATAVKKADNRSNADPDRLSAITDIATRNRLISKYTREWEWLNRASTRAE